MRTAVLSACVAVVAAALTACAATVSGQALGGATSELSSASQTRTTSSGTTSRATIEPAPSATQPSGTAVLDPATATWFETFCEGITDATQYAVADTSGQSIAELQATVVAAYSSIAVSASGTAAALSLLTPPPIEGGQRLHEAGVARFTSLADTYSQGASTVAALQPTSAADLEGAVEAVEQQAAAGAAETMATVPREVLDAAKELPACAGVLG